MPKISAGLLMYRIVGGQTEVLLVHPGGPYWQRKDDGSWTFPRGEIGPGEDELSAAIREFSEETGLHPQTPFLTLGEVKLRSGKIVRAWAFQGSADPKSIRSNFFEIEWPPKSGRHQQFQEIDRAEFFTIADAERKMRIAEKPFLTCLAEQVSRS
jgi:predicted NUDIX family NTP pyrophosphohydrolase